MNISKNTYAKQMSWNDFYKQGNSLKKDTNINISWRKLFDERIFNDDKFTKLEDDLKELVDKDNESDGIKMYPLPEYVFNAFRVTSLDDLKVVFIGQDPYFNCEYKKGKFIPQATGLSFSVPMDFKIPSSLANIFSNQLKYNRLKCEPASGNLTFWACQGCLMLNTALTVLDGRKNVHSAMWKWVTDRIIKYISDECKYVVFVMWGRPAYDKVNLIDLDKHDIIVSSHPSGLSAHKPMGQYLPFNDQDHFGQINELLDKRKKNKILWQI